MLNTPARPSPALDGIGQANEHTHRRPASMAFLVSTGLVVLIVTVQAVTAIGFFAGITVSPYHLIAGVIASAGWCWWVAGEQGAGRPLGPRLMRTASAVATIFGLLLAALLLAGRFYDVSPDGQTYHQRAIIDLAFGWNPVYAPQAPAHFSIVNFPKGPWLSAASVYALTGRVEQAKGFNALLIVAAFLLVLETVRSVTKLPLATSVLVSGLAAANPVAVTQALSFYVDGQLASYLLMLTCAALLVTFRPSRITKATFALLLVAAVNVKLTALVYVLLFGIGSIVGTYLADRARVRETTLVAVTAIAFGTVVVGFNPYVVNTVGYRNPFYPMAGPNARIGYEDQRPANFNDMKSITRLAASLLSRAQWGTQAAELKWPFTLSVDELRSNAYPDTRTAGFGPLFGGAMILATVSLGLSGSVGGRRADVRAALAVVAGLLMSVVIIPEAWWARYVPQLWLIPVVSAVTAVAMVKRRVVQILGYAVLAVLVVNVLAVGGYYALYQYRQTAELSAQLARLAGEPGGVAVAFRGFSSNSVRLKEAGVRYVEISDDELANRACREQFTLLNSEAVVCVGG